MLGHSTNSSGNWCSELVVDGRASEFQSNSVSDASFLSAQTVLSLTTFAHNPLPFICTMETRKRQIADDAEATLPKKRALIDNRGSPTPHVNGLATDGDEPKDDNLEASLLLFLWCHRALINLPYFSSFAKKLSIAE